MKSPKDTANWTATDTVPVPNRRPVNSRTSSSGRATRSSISTNIPAAANPAPAASSTTVSVQPRCGASNAATVTRPMATAADSAPHGSKGGRDESDDSGTVYAATASTAPAAAIAIMIDNHDQRAISSPEPRMPSTAPPPTVPAQMPTATLRFARGSPAVRRDSVDGITSAAPAPATARAEISQIGPSISSGTAEATANSTSPAISISLRP